MSGVSRQRRTVLKAGLALCGVAALGAAAREWRGDAELAEYGFSGETMGTFYNVRFMAAMGDHGLREAARSAVARALAGVDARMSSFRPDSELSRLNRHGPSPFPLSAPTFAVLRAAHDVASASAGAFDASAGPLVDAWGFGPGRNPRVPEKGELARLRERVGYRMLELDPGTRSARKGHPGMALDLSGIAKGYGVDGAAQALEALGIRDYVVETGGEVRARGMNVHGAPWQVAIEEPQSGPRRPRCVVPLAGQSLATSGDYRIFFQRHGQRYCHEIDPVAGSPVRHALTSVSVLANECAHADAWATALMILGPEEGYRCAERLGMGAYFITRGAEGLQERATPAFRALGARPIPA